MTNPVSWESLPEELRWFPQWCIAGPDDKGKNKAPYVASRNGGLGNASNTYPAHWKDFESVCEAAEARGLGIGFVLHESDPYTVIDLDVKDAENCDDPSLWTSPEQFERYQRIIEAFDSYTELSTSGKGVHIWVRGKIGLGCKRDGVEVYSQTRFIVCTGNIIKNTAIRDQQDLLDILVAEIRKQQGASGAALDLTELTALEDDQTIINRAMEAGNSDKFVALCQGRWNELGYPSQSEADLSLLSMFTFYSRSNEQCRRLFRMTELGKRKKAVVNDVYLDRTLKIIRGRQAREANVDHLQAQAAALLVAQAQAAAPALPQVPESAPMAASVPYQQASTPAPAQDIPWPPGFAGVIANYMYQAAPRPVKEVAIVATLGLLSGIAGKAFIIPGSGLNQYIVLVARSAIGKEAMHSGISNLMGHVREAVPSAMSFVDFTEYASGPALMKAVAANPSFLNISGEWGRKLRRLAVEDGRDGPMQQLRTCMTNLYQKSGPQSIVGGLGYSDKEKNVSSVAGVAYSMIGETTPGTFYEALTDTMMEDGFLSRFTIIEYAGERPAANHSPLRRPDPSILEAMCAMCVQALTLISRFTYQEIQRTWGAAKMMDDFDKECDYNINSTQDESYRQMWNRAHLKACRIAAVLAVADNWLQPLITEEHFNWALLVIRKDIEMFGRRMSEGDIGTGDSTRERKILSVCKDFLADLKPNPTYGVTPAMAQAAVIPRRYIQLRCSRVSQFTQHKMGATAALDASLRSLIDSGYLAELDKLKAAEFGFSGKCYRILTLPPGLR